MLDKLDKGVIGFFVVSISDPEVLSKSPGDHFFPNFSVSLHFHSVVIQPNQVEMSLPCSEFGLIEAFVDERAAFVVSLFLKSSRNFVTSLLETSLSEYMWCSVCFFFEVQMEIIGAKLR